MYKNELLAPPYTPHKYSAIRERVYFLRLEFGFYLNFAVAEFVLCATATSTATAAREKRVERDNDLLRECEMEKCISFSTHTHTHISP